MLEKSETFLRVLTQGRRSREKLRLFPLVKFLLRFGNQQKVHPGVLCPAKLCAKAQVRCGFVGLNPQMIRVPWHGRKFSPQLRHPKLVQDIHGIQSERDWFADGNMNFIRHDSARVRVARFPPPLVTDHQNIGLRRWWRV